MTKETSQTNIRFAYEELNTFLNLSEQKAINHKRFRRRTHPLKNRKCDNCTPIGISLMKNEPLVKMLTV